MKPKFFVVDIETLGTHPDSAIISIGAVLNLPDGEQRTFDSGPIDLTEQLLAGAHIDQKTVQWWMGQPDQTKGYFKAPTVRLNRALNLLDQFLSGQETQTDIWAQGPQFDQIVLEAAFRRCQMTPPWKYNQWRDVRTLKSFFTDEFFRKNEHIKHNALHDALHDSSVVRLLLPNVNPNP